MHGVKTTNSDKKNKSKVPRRILNLILSLKRKQLTGSDLDAAPLDLDGIAL